MPETEKRPQRNQTETNETKKNETEIRRYIFKRIPKESDQAFL